ELAQDAPGAGARAVFVNAFHGQVPGRKARRVEHLGQELFRPGVAVQYRVLAAFLVVQDELQGDARAAGPSSVGRVAAVAGEIARVRGSAVVGHDGCSASITVYTSLSTSSKGAAMGLSTHVLDTMHG